MALQQQIIDPWPYDTAVVAIEHNTEFDLTQGHIISHWAYVGTQTLVENQLPESPDIEQIQFDIETYRILIKHLKNTQIVALNDNH